jgi:hypothetical protein
MIELMEKDGLVGPGEGIVAELIARWDGDSAMVN